MLRDHLLDTAEQLLASAEVGTITAREVATSAGVSTGVLYNYFSDKNELLLAALARRFAGLVSSFRDDLANSQAEDAAQGARALAELLYQLNRDALPLFGKLLAEPALLRRFVVEIHDAGHPFGGRQIRDAVVDFLAREPFATADAGAAADLLLGAVALQALTDLLAGRGDSGVKEQLHRAAELLLGGLAPAQPRRAR